jgi:hypothetical protein
MATDAQSLLTQANCFKCVGDSPYVLTLMQLALLQQIATAPASGGGGSGGNVTAGVGPPAFTPTSAAAIYFDTSTGAQWDWYSGAWH